MDMACSPAVDRIQHLFERHGADAYEGARRESVTALEHALQCAQLAEWAHADAALVAAAFLHDIGHFLAAEAVARDDRVDDRHELLALDLIGPAFGPAVAEPVRLHVEAKRCLVRVESAYAATLSPASVHSLVLQGGPMSDAEIEAFDALPHSRAALQLRRWDDLAKHPGKRTPPLAYYLALLRDLQGPDLVALRTGIGAPDAA